MARRYLAFDIETAKEVPGVDFNWRPHRPLGISCAATLASDAAQPVLWHGKAPGDKYAKRMSRADAQALAEHLAKMVADGYTVLTWNGLGFDFDILAEESGAGELCKQHALGHVDMMFHFFCAQGYPIGLEKTAQGMGLPGKASGLSGFEVPGMWAKGKHKEVLEYVAQDVRMALDIAQLAEKRKSLAWITQKGVKRSMPLTKGWLTVRDALLLPQPDTSWMTKPMARQAMTAWLSAT